MTITGALQCSLKVKSGCELATTEGYWILLEVTELSADDPVVFCDNHAKDIHKRKRLTKSQHILDHMGATELAANLFRSTQAEEKLRRDQVQGKDYAKQVHYQAGMVSADPYYAMDGVAEAIEQK